MQKLPHLQGHWDSIRSRFNELKNQLEQSTKHKIIAQTSAMLAHDLRAPIHSFERLLYLPEDEKLENHRESIRLALSRLNNMIEAFRNTDLELLVRPLRVSFEIEKQVQEFLEKASLIGKELSLEVDEIPIVNIDLMKFERAWVNLVSNAIDFANSHIQIKVKVLASDLILQVIDDGAGVPDEFLPKLFQRGATHGKHDGTGLGLAYVRQIMRGHGGDVSYRRENGWTVFECRIPNAVVQEGEEIVNSQVIESSASTQSQTKVVGVCLIPDSLGDPIYAHLLSLKTKKFHFSREYDKADFIISNDEDILLKALAEGKNPVEVDMALPLDKTLTRLDRRFNPA